MARRYAAVVEPGLPWRIRTLGRHERQPTARPAIIDAAVTLALFGPLLLLTR